MRLSEEEHQKRLALYEKGLSDHSIAKELGTHYTTIWGWRKSMGLKSNFKAPSLSMESHNERMRLYSQGLSDSEISKIVGCNKLTIHRWRLRNNLLANFMFGSPKNKLPTLNHCSIVKQAEIMAEVRDDDESLFKDKKLLEKMGLECDDDA